jgi:hypothetical protein
LFSAILGIFGEWFWFLSLGYESVFLEILITRILLGLVFGISFFVFVMINIKIAKRVCLGKKRARLKNDLMVLIALIFAVMIGSGFSDWKAFLMFLNPSNFAGSDPVFGMNIGFYVFTLPFYSFIYSFLMTLIILTLVITSLSYFLYSGSFQRKEIEMDVEGQASYTLDWEPIKEKLAPHVGFLIGILFFILSLGFFLSRYFLLFSETGVVFGAGYTDLHVILPFLGLMSFLSIVVGFAFCLNIKFRKKGLPTKVLIGFIMIGVMGLIVSGVTQAFIVAPNEFNLESPYIERNIRNTLDAYNLDKIEERLFPISYNLTKEDIRKNNGTIQNIRLWDWRPLMSTYNQLQLFRTYYHFWDIDIDRYNLDGEYKQVMVSARELNIKNLPSKAKTWVNKHLVYTHGYGIVMNPVDKVSKEGLPEFYVKDIPPKSEFFKFERPEIYYGEGVEEYAIVRTTTDEFDYPSGEKNIYTSYEGSGGVRLSDSFKKLVYAVKFGSIELLVSGSLKPESRVLLYRNIMERVNNIAPFLSYDNDPYIVVSEGKLYWILDGYTVTNMYPYSEPIHSKKKGAYFNYIRNSVKVVIDSYNGDVKFYVIDEEDPLINTYRKIFPDLFLDFSEMSEDLRKHVRYPEDLFKIQALLYSQYHMKDPMVFYNKEDVWVIPHEIYRQGRQETRPYYIIMRFPDKEKEEFILMIPFIPKNKENLIAWMAARCDFPDYGDLVVFQFSKQVLTYGPMQIEARIDQDTEISQRITLWSQAGSSIIRGNTLIIPIENSLIYIEPLYLEATEKGTLPELKRVIVAYGDRLTMKKSLQESLNEIFGEIVKPEIPELPPETPEDILAKLSELYKKAEESMREGNLSKYAEYVNQIGEILKTWKGPKTLQSS